MENELKFVQIATSESASIDGSNGENLNGLTEDGEVYYYTCKMIGEERVCGWKKLSMRNLDNKLKEG